MFLNNASYEFNCLRLNLHYKDRYSKNSPPNLATSSTSLPEISKVVKNFLKFEKYILYRIFISKEKYS